jgi:hypothetical protein
LKIFQRIHYVLSYRQLRILATIISVTSNNLRTEKLMTPQNISNCKIIEFSQIRERSGCITPVENNKDIPFSVNRIYYLYDVPGGARRGGHAHKELSQIIVAASGSFEVILDDGNQKKTIELTRPYFGLLVVPGIWRDLVNFSSGAICLVLASNLYNESDYIRDYGEYLEYVQK